MKLNFIHDSNYADVIKVASKFTSKHAHRPTLFFVNHDKDGSIVATDSHKFIKVNGIHGFDKDYLVHPKTLEFATGNYPDVENRIGASVDNPTKIELNKEQIAIWLQLHRSINQLSKHYDARNRVVKLTVTEKIMMKIGRENSVEMELPFTNITGGHYFNYNAEYMRDCLEVHHVLGTNKLSIVISGPMRPVQLIGDNGDVKSGLVPVRSM